MLSEKHLKAQIENGLSRNSFIQWAAINGKPRTDEEIELFDRLSDEVNLERQVDDNIQKGFASVPCRFQR